MDQPKNVLPKVLVVDDDLTATHLVNAALKKDFVVYTEASGSEAIATAMTYSPDLILLDLHMPNVDGYEVLRKLKTVPGTSSIPIICMSGDIVQESRDRATHLGAIGYFQKPLNMRNLSSDIKHLMSSLNVVMESKLSALRFTLAFNQGEKFRLMRSDLSDRLVRGETCLLLSLLNGKDFVNDELKEYLGTQKLIYLQIIPSLIAKFPFMEDLSPITDELRNFSLCPLSELHLFFDDPSILLGSENPHTGLTRLYGLKDLFISAFKHSDFYVSLESAKSSRQLNELAELFCR